MEILSAKQLEEIRELDTPTICNALEVFNIRPRLCGFTRPGMQLRTESKKPIVGYAATARVSGKYPGKNVEEKLLGYYESVRNTEGPVIACIEDIDKEPIGSFWGEVQATMHIALGSVGTITDGGVRDLDEVSKMGYTMFSKEVLASHGYIHVEDYNCVVDVFGLCVHPGDLIFADQHGAVVIPHEVAPKLVETCKKVAHAEMAILGPCREAIKNGVTPTMDDIKAWRKALAEEKKKY